MRIHSHLPRFLHTSARGEISASPVINGRALLDKLRRHEGGGETPSLQFGYRSGKSMSDFSNRSVDLHILCDQLELDTINGIARRDLSASNESPDHDLSISSAY